ncbi:MAG TPA: hypothetical protein DGQ94_09625 [Pseudomonas sp.]|nr:hypothetical protein [Pseudomonas sp.]
MPEGTQIAWLGTIFPPFISRQAEVGAKYDLGRVAFTASALRIRQPAYETNAISRVFGRHAAHLPALRHPRFLKRAQRLPAQGRPLRPWAR